MDPGGSSPAAPPTVALLPIDSGGRTTRIGCAPRHFPSRSRPRSRPASRPLTREEFRQVQRDDRLRDRGGREYGSLHFVKQQPENGLDLPRFRGLITS